MKVLVTGGTGHVGSHVVLGLLTRGHDVRLLARRKERVDATFAPYADRPGPDPVTVPRDVVVGDVLDGDAVRRALEGCDATVHAAAVFSFDPARADEVTRTNAQAARTVLPAAVDAGCGRVVHVSSTVALIRRGTVPADLPLGDLRLPYAVSKQESERVARGLQDRGAPVACVYPGAVFGPGDPYRGVQTNLLDWVARGMLPVWPAGGMHAVDAREVAATVVAALDHPPAPDEGPGRWVVPGTYITGRELFGAVGTALGRRRPFATLPAGVLRAAAGPAARLDRFVAPRHVPADEEAVDLLDHSCRFDTRTTSTTLGVHARPFDETVRDHLAWMVRAGTLPPRYAPVARA